MNKKLNSTVKSEFVGLFNSFVGFNELKRRTNDVQFRNNIDQFLNIIRNASKDKSRKFYSTEINKYYDEYVRLFNKKWGEIRDIFDDINEEYGLEKPKSY